MSFYMKRWSQACEIIEEKEQSFQKLWQYVFMSEIVNLTTTGALANSLKILSKSDIFAGKINKGFCRLNC
jgi:glycine/serine hydroxymethyltransferase